VLTLARRRGGPWSHSAGLHGERLRVARALALLGLLMLALQLALGGWTSSNYAALACPDLPTCRGSWWPPADYRSGYTLWRGIESQGLVAIHLVHRSSPRRLRR
jgi:heme A synthase